jgi:hypothetical protein
MVVGCLCPGHSLQWLMLASACTAHPEVVYCMPAPAWTVVHGRAASVACQTSMPSCCTNHSVRYMSSIASCAQLLAFGSPGRVGCRACCYTSEAGCQVADATPAAQLCVVALQPESRTDCGLGICLPCNTVQCKTCGLYVEFQARGRQWNLLDSQIWQTERVQ